uniref:Uncharacterized protein n=1 Tax=Alexandrium andersonii TaxID=327968 RepID=A0A7S2IS17_9DINO
MTACGWGTPLLIVQHGAGFNTYRTPLSKTGEPGSVYKENSNHLKELSVGSPRTSGGKQYRFMYSNGRLVICKSQADAAAGSISTSGSLSPGRSGSSSMSDWSPAGGELSIGRSFSDPN